jgi:hypothetical protein
MTPSEIRNQKPEYHKRLKGNLKEKYLNKNMIFSAAMHRETFNQQNTTEFKQTI